MESEGLGHRVGSFVSASFKITAKDFTDETHKQEYLVGLKWQRNPAIASLDTPELNPNTFDYGTTLGEIELPEGWSWVDSNDVRLPVGTTEASARYTLSDNDKKYYDWSNVEGYDAEAGTVTRDIALTITKGDALPTDLVSCTGLLDSEGRTDDQDTVLDNALSTTKTILIQRSRWVLAGIAVILSDFIYFWITKRIVSADSMLALLVVAIAGGVGCSLACLVSDQLSKDRTYVNVIMSDNLEAMQAFRDFLAEYHITNVAADTYTLDWNTKTITITAYPETKAESRLITRYIEESPLKFKRLVQPG